MEWNGVGLLLDTGRKVDEVLVHGESFLHLLVAHALEAIEDLSGHDVEHVVDLDQIEEQHIDEVLEESCLLAELPVFEHVHDEGDELIKLFINEEDVIGPQFLDIPWCFHHLL